MTVREYRQLLNRPCFKQVFCVLLLVAFILCFLLPQHVLDTHPVEKDARCPKIKDLSKVEDLTCSSASTSSTIKKFTQSASRSGHQADEDLFCEPLPKTFDNDSSFLPCDWDSRKIKCPKRVRAIPHCTISSSPKLRHEIVSVDTPPVTLPFKDKCLDDFIKCACFDEGLHVPRVVHYVNFGKREFPFFAFVSLMSVVRFFQPCVILMHGDELPNGMYWNLTLQLVPRLIHIHQERPTSIFGNKVEVVQHQADIVRLKAVTYYGGLYVDMDMWLLRSLDEFRSFQGATLGQDQPTSICNAMYMAMPNASFLHRWHSTYTTFNDKHWAEHSCMVPFRMSRQSPQEVRLSQTFFHPFMWDIVCMCYVGTFQWQKKHAMHLWHSAIKFPDRPKLERKASSLGEILRHILFGSTNNCVKNNCDVTLVRDDFIHNKG